MAYTYRVAPKNRLQLKNPPPLQGAQRPQRADSVRRVCGGVADTHAGI